MSLFFKRQVFGLFAACAGVKEDESKSSRKVERGVVFIPVLCGVSSDFKCVRCR